MPTFKGAIPFPFSLVIFTTVITISAVLFRHKVFLVRGYTLYAPFRLTKQQEGGISRVVNIVNWLKRADNDEIGLFRDRTIAYFSNIIRAFIWIGIIVICVAIFLKISGIKLFMDDENRTHIILPSSE